MRVSDTAPGKARMSGKTMGWVLFIVGMLMLGIGLIYDPSVSSGLESTYNLGAISFKSTYTNTGGFLAVCGSIFIKLP